MTNKPHAKLTRKKLAKMTAAAPLPVRWAAGPAQYLVDNMRMSKNQRFREFLRLTRGNEQ